MNKWTNEDAPEIEWRVCRWLNTKAFVASILTNTTRISNLQSHKARDQNQVALTTYQEPLRCLIRNARTVDREGDTWSDVVVRSGHLSVIEESDCCMGDYELHRIEEHGRRRTVISCVKHKIVV